MLISVKVRDLRKDFIVQFAIMKNNKMVNGHGDN